MTQKKSLKEIMSKLDCLYEKTGKDWDITIHHTLTEPTCPTVIINPEGKQMTRYRVDRGSIEEAIEAAVDLVYREVICGEKIEPECPWANPDDKP